MPLTPQSPTERAIPTPEFQRIRQEAGRATEDAIRLLWLFGNNSLRVDRRQNTALQEQASQIEDQQAALEQQQQQLQQQQDDFEALFDWTDRPFNAGDFTADATWTVSAGNFLFYRTLVVRDLALIWLGLTNTTINGGPSELRLALPFEIDASTVTQWNTLLGAVDVHAPNNALTHLRCVVQPRIVGGANTSLRLTRIDGTATFPNASSPTGGNVSLIAMMKIVP